MARRPAEVEILTGCIEDLEDLSWSEDLTDEEQAEVERGVREGKRLLRRAFIEAARHSRSLPAMDGYPRPEDLEPARWHAETLWSLMKDLPEEQQLAMAGDCGSWALVERVCAESVNQASRDIERAASLARLARAIAGKVRGPESWCARVQGYAALHGSNITRVAGELKAARVDFEIAERLWNAGTDPGHVLDPGRMLDLKVSLCRDERRFEEALRLLDEAREVSHCPGRILINKGFTLEVMGEFERAAETLLQAEPLVERLGDPRLLYMLRFNLAVNYTHLGKFGEASDLVQQVCELAGERRDENEVTRSIWLSGRIAAGLGRIEEARGLLELARREFAARQMWYDVALAQLELVFLLLAEGRHSEVKKLANELIEVFDSKGVHREALAALRLFYTQRHK